MLDDHLVAELEIRIQYLSELLGLFRVEFARLFLFLNLELKGNLNLSVDLFRKAINLSILISLSLISWVMIDLSRIIK